MHSALVGLHFMDRAPLDFYTFSKSNEENKKKTKELRDCVTRNRDLQDGEILFIEAEPWTLVKRNMARGRSPESAGLDDYFSEQIKVLKEIYAPTFVLSTDEYNAG